MFLSLKYIKIYAYIIKKYLGNLPFIFLLVKKNSKIATVGIEPTTLALLAPRSNQTELCGFQLFFIKKLLNVIRKNIF